MRSTLKALSSVYGATGREEKAAALIRSMVESYVDEIRTDALGNLICVRKSRSGSASRRIMFAAHMDHIGFVVTGIDENGFLRVNNVGGIRVKNSMNRHVVFENGVHGILSHEVKDFNDTIGGMFIDIGAGSREEAEKMIQIGDLAVYASDVFDLGGCVCGPAMDNRASCAVLVQLLKHLKDTPCDVIAVFTTQEEVGMRGATAAAYSVHPDVGIALDVTLCGDTPKGVDIDVKLGKGVAIKVMDSSVICTPSVVRALIGCAEREKITYQREVLVGGGTDGAAIQLSSGGIPTGVLSIPCRYVHSATECVNVQDCENAVSLLIACLEHADL